MHHSVRSARAMLVAWAEGLGRLLLPPHCLLCGRALERFEALCGECLAGLPLAGERTCPRCGRPVGPHVRVGTDCVECRRLPLAHLAAVTCAGAYAGDLREMVLRFKHGASRALGHALADLSADALRRRPWLREVEVLVPVPVHWRRRWERGFNQAERLAAALGAALRRPVARRALVRHRYTPSQVGLSVRARLANVAGSMRTTRRAGRLAGRTVLVVDDVMTTGATLSEAARVLGRAGAGRVFGAVAAARCRALPPDPATAPWE